MYLRRCRRILLAITLSITLFACGSTEKEAQYGIQTLDTVTLFYDFSAYENGLLYRYGNDGNSQIYFLDYETFQGVPFCNKPNCTHSDGTCLAAICAGDASSAAPVVYQNYVYYFCAESELVESEDGKSSTYETTTTCYRGALDTGEVEIFSTFSYNAAQCTFMELNQNKLYFIACDNWYQKQDGTWGNISESGPQYLCSLNLDTGEYEQIGRVNDTEYAANSWGELGDMHYSYYAAVYIDGIYQDKLYMHYQYLEDKQILLDKLMDESATDDDDMSDLPWKFENCVYDFETGELTIGSDLPYASAISEEVYVYWDTEKAIYIARLADGTEKEVEGISKTDSFPRFRILNGKVWGYGEQGYSCFDLKTGEIAAVSNGTYGDFYYILDYTNGQYIIEYYDESGTLCFDKVSESELIQAAE